MLFSIETDKRDIEKAININDKTSILKINNRKLEDDDLENNDNYQENQNTYSNNENYTKSIIKEIQSLQPDENGNIYLTVEKAIEVRNLLIKYSNKQDSSSSSTSSSSSSSSSTSKKRHKRHRNRRMKHQKFEKKNRNMRYKIHHYNRKYKQEKNLWMGKYPIRKNQQLNYAGSAASFKDVPNLIVVASGIMTIYNNLFNPIQTNGTSNTLSQVVYYTGMYVTLRNFAIAFSKNQTGIESDLNTILSSTNSIGFTKNEVLAFFGSLDLYNSLLLSSAAFQAPFQAQNIQLTSVCANFSNIAHAIATNINTVLGQNTVILQSVQTLLNSPSAKPDLATIDSTLMTIPTLLGSYATIQSTLIDLQIQLNALKAMNTSIQQILSNMQLISKGQAISGSSIINKVVSTALMTFVYVIIA